MIENKKHYPAICFTKLPNSAINHSIRVSRFIHTFGHDGAPERRGRQDRQQYAGPLLGGLHAGYIRPRYHGRAAQSGANDGQYPIPCCLTVSATRSRWGQRIQLKCGAQINLGSKKK